MPATNIFQSLRQKVTESKGLLPAEKRAMFWFSKYSMVLRDWQRGQRHVTYGNLQKEDISKQIVQDTQVQPGFLYFFVYQPKHEVTLRYYDRFPFVLALDRSPNSFLGLNFHYLDYYYRAMLFDAFWPLRQNVGPDDLRTRLHLSYELLQNSSKYKMFRPCIKRYLFSCIPTPLLKVGASEWDIALFLPVESFAKVPTEAVWEESNRKF